MTPNKIGSRYLIAVLQFLAIGCSKNIRETSVSFCGTKYRPEALQVACHDPEVSDLRPLQRLKRVSWIDVSQSGISSFNGIERHPSIKYITAHDCRRLKSLQGLAQIPRLEELDLSHTAVSNVRALSANVNLKDIRLTGTPLETLDGIQSLTNLQTLDVSYTPVSGTRPVSSLSKLVYLGLTKTRVNDLSPLSDLPKLRVLYIDSTQVVDLSPIGRLPELEEIEISMQAAQDLGSLAHAPALSKVIFVGPDDFSQVGAQFKTIMPRVLMERWDVHRSFRFGDEKMPPVGDGLASKLQ